MPNSVLWIDITELFGEFQHVRHPTGVSRVVLNLVDELIARPPSAFGAVRPLFWDPVSARPVTLDDWSALGSLRSFFVGLRQRYCEAGMERPVLPSGLRKGLVTSVPRRLRYRLFPHLTGATQFLAWARAQRLVVAPVSFAARDMLFVPGSFWLGGYAPGLARKMRAAGGSVAAFVHDVLLLSHPEWMPGRHGAQFERGAASFLPQCDLIVCNSQNTRDELRRFVTLPPEVVIEVGRLADRIDAEPSQPEVSLAGKQFALFVSSLTPRKNHVLAVRAWNLLRNELAERTPYLVLVGGGHPDAALAAAMADDAHGAPRVLRLRDVTDAELAWLYRHAWLTLYPSLGEGYGLPVAEAMAFGKLCIASRAGGIAEIARDLVDVADLHDPAALAALVRSYFTFPERLDAREQAIRSGYRSTGWRDCAEIVGQHLVAARERKTIMRRSEQSDLTDR